MKAFPFPSSAAVDPVEHNDAQKNCAKMCRTKTGRQVRTGTEITRSSIVIQNIDLRLTVLAFCQRKLELGLQRTWQEGGWVGGWGALFWGSWAGWVTRASQIRTRFWMSSEKDVSRSLCVLHRQMFLFVCLFGDARACTGRCSCFSGNVRLRG